MPTISISVTDKIAKVEGSPVIICGNSDYEIEWSLDSEWDSLTPRQAHFEFWNKKGNREAKDVSFSGTTVSVPVLNNIDRVDIMLYAGDIHTSSPVCIPCIRTVTQQDEPEPVPPSPTPQIAAIYGHLENDALATLTESAVYQKDSAADLTAAQAWAEANFPIPCTFTSVSSCLGFVFGGLTVVPDNMYGNIRAFYASEGWGSFGSVSGDNHFKMFVTASHIIFASGKVTNGTFTAHNFAVVGKDKDGTVGVVYAAAWGVSTSDPVGVRILVDGGQLDSAWLSRTPSQMTLLYNVQSDKYSEPSVFGDMFFAFNVENGLSGGVRLGTVSLEGTQYYHIDHAVFFTEG